MQGDESLKQENDGSPVNTAEKRIYIYEWCSYSNRCR